MPGDVVGHKAGDEIVGMVIARLHPDRGRNAGLAGSHGQQTRLRLFVEVVVCLVVIDQLRGQSGAVFEQRGAGAAGLTRTRLHRMELWLWGRQLGS